MRKKLLPFITILTLALFLGACNSEDVMPEIDKGATSRTITFTASMPGEDDPATRVSVAEEADRTIALTWEADDKLDLLFVQGTNKFHESTTVTNIENGGKNATFTVPLPDGITDGTPYNLYGVYGGGAVSTDNPALIGLPAIEEEALNEENVGKKVMLRFAKENLNLTDAVGAVNFKHVGFLFTAKIKVTAGSIDDITSVQLVGADAANETWAYNASENHFNIETGTFTAEGTRGNTVNFQNSEKDATNTILTVRNWLPATETAWPAIKLSINGTTETATTKPGRTPEASKAYYLYATWDGADLVFADKDFTVPQTGTKISIADLRAAFVQGETYEEDHYIEGEVILNPYQENTPDFVVYVADNTAGITLTINDKENLMAKLPLGAKVRINVQTSEWNKFNGLIQLGLSTDNVEIIEETSSTPLVPKVVSIQDVLDGNYQSELVQVNNVQFKDIPATYHYNQTLTNAEGEETTVFTRSQATFADTGVIEGNGPFIGVVSHHSSGAQLLIRSLDDLAGMTGIRVEPPFMNVNPTLLSFEKEAGSETIAVTSNVSWTASSNAAWATVSPASGANNGTITVNAQPNTGADARNAVITITGSGITETVAVVQAGTVAPSTDLLFPGSDFNNWTTFTSSLNSKGLLAGGTQSEAGGRNGSGALLFNKTQSSNAYLFTAKVPAGFDATGKTKITFWIKGTSTGRALSMNVYTGTGTTSGTDYKCYNIPSGTTSDVVLEPTGTNNYMGSINTSGEWIKVTLDISSIVDNINATQGQNLFAIKVGKSGVYDLLVDDIMIE